MNYKEILKDLEIPANKILVVPIDHEAKSKGGLLIHTHSRFNTKKGHVVKVGLGKFNEDKSFRIENELAEDDIILFDPDKTKSIKYNSNTYLLLEEPEGIMGVIGTVENGEIKLYVETII